MPLNDNFELSGSFNLNNVYGENTRLMDVDLTLRYLPFYYYLFRPYIGAGYGYYQLDETYELPCPDDYICYGYILQNHRNMHLVPILIF